MKKISALFCFLCFACVSTTRGQLFFNDNVSMQYFLLQHTGLAIHANYLRLQPPSGSSPSELDTTGRHFQYDSYSRELVVTIADINAAEWALPGLSGQFFTDLEPAGRDLYDLGKMEIRITRNGQETGWLPVKMMPAFKDEWIRHKKDAELYQTAYWLYNDTLAVGDSLQIAFRNKRGENLLSIGFVRKPTDLRPFCLHVVHDTVRRSEQAYLEGYINMQRMADRSEAFYKDWPRNNFPGLKSKLFPGSRLTFFFRKPSFTNDERPFEYRFTGGRFNMNWERSGPVILSGPLQAGDNARLEVRYRERPKELYTYHFYVPEAYYQKPVFKTILYAGIAMLLMLGVFIFITRKRKRELNRRKLEMKTLYAQLNPHFMFNALSSIQGLVNDRQTDKANEYLTGFATLLRRSMESGQKETVPLEQELKHLENYIRLEKLRFNFEYAIASDPSLPLKDLEVPPFLAQPLVENAVKHGVSGKGEQGRVTIRVTKEGRDVVFSISDNGPGFDPAGVSGRQGIRLTRDRIALFNKTNREKQVLMDIQSNSAGTTVVLVYKNWTEHA